jgi:NAD(P)-dependent dehydrogenase (short-subunit alcohol dehydrogenase family)
MPEIDAARARATGLERRARLADNDAGSSEGRGMGSKGKLEGRKALVTGGSRGIGAAIVRSFAAEGAKVGLLHLGDFDRAERLVAELGLQGRAAFALERDVADPDAVAGAIGEVEAKLGEIDILVNCAGVVDQRPFGRSRSSTGTG